MKYIIEYTKTVDYNGNNIPITDETEYTRYNDIIFQDYDSAYVYRCDIQKNLNDVYVRIKEIF